MTSKLIKAFLYAKEAVTQTEISGRNFQIRLHTPDFTHNDISSWGDWGPMYKIGLKPEQKITVEYTHIETHEVMTETITPRSIELLSPAVAIVRKETPLYFEVFEPTQSVLFRIYLNNEGLVASVKANSLYDKVPGRLSSQVVRAV
ncbi:MAG: hypothetical protein HRT44_05205 [Bdellovibrionales bacterium]|nr:hypothetical protein [Bdellovibrionales bacterium]NQZ18640.1 hypothetical protein [Bdellovibrionales bacterium]